MMRTGIGTDTHAYGDGFGLRLAGLDWPADRALAGHSDGDVAAHALCDALFSAAGIGDLGTHFGIDRPELKGAPGVTLLAEAASLVRAAGFEIRTRPCRSSATLRRWEAGASRRRPRCLLRWAPR